MKTRPPLPSPRLLSAPPPGSLLTGPSAVPPVQLVSRKLYRFLRYEHTIVRAAMHNMRVQAMHCILLKM